MHIYRHVFYLKISHEGMKKNNLNKERNTFVYLDYTLKNLPYIAPKRSTDLLATKICLKLHHILVSLSELFAIINYGAA